MPCQFPLQTLKVNPFCRYISKTCPAVFCRLVGLQLLQTTISFVVTDIEQPLTRGNLINLAHFLPEHPKDFDLHLVETFNEVVHLILHDHADSMNPFEELEDPT